jgi:hypothetical protein
VERQPKVVTDDHWKLIDEHERTAGGSGGRPRVKVTSVAELLRIVGYAGQRVGDAARLVAESDSWSQVAELSGTSRQAAWERWRMS